MRADRDDAPDYIDRRKEGPWRLISIMVIGSAITWAGMALFAKPIVIDVAQLQSAIRFGDQPAPAATEPRPNIPAPTAQPSNSMQTAANAQSDAQDLTWKPSTARRSPEIRQISFNDHNYAPKTDVNTMQAPPSKFYAANTQSQQRQTVRRIKTSKWIWENGYNKQRISGIFEWVEINDSIDYNTVCQNYQRGSFIYRDCRKGAKVAFAKMCGSYQPACHAANNYMP